MSKSKWKTPEEAAVQAVLASAGLFAKQPRARLRGSDAAAVLINFAEQLRQRFEEE